MYKKTISLILVTASILTLYNYFKNLSFIDKYIIIQNKYIEENIVLENYIIGVVACEMPALYNDEALKAQAIAARTYASYQSDNNIKLLTTTDDQCYITEGEMKEKWGHDFETYHKKIKNIVNSTKGIVMNKNNKLFKSFYFSTSNGYTENSQTVFKEENLKSVNSSWDKTSKNYYKEIEFTKENLENILGQFTNIKIIKRNKTNHVEEIKIDNKIMTGIEFRKKLKLRSTDFEIEKKDKIYTIKTYGYGHGVGMSQYGANELAKKGYTYEEILDYYYSEIDLVNLYV